MTKAPYEAIHIEQMPELEYEDKPEDVHLHPIRIHFGITSFGANAFSAEKGGAVIGEHRESDESGTRYEELYYVSRGRAKFTIEGEEVDAPAGTFLYIRDPEVLRGAISEEDGTTIVCLGGTPGQAFEVSPWERPYDPAAR